jgi:FkbH-like protein
VQLSVRPASESRSSEITSIQNDVKMVIWDLDETFWKGTLAESEIEFVQSNADIVRTLAARGIISSIASKNDHDTAKEILEREGIWDYFVFPSISFDPKGRRVAEIIQNAALRPENVLFIDDTTMNLEEVRYFNNGIMLAHPDDLIPILNHPRLYGKSDPGLKRLKQYQLLERKWIDQKSTRLSNEEFLRSCDISICFDFDVDSNFDRIVDLINRANQLNYTKKRFNTSEQTQALRSSLTEYGVSAACISCRDKYGDYGVVGFYALKKNRKQFDLLHFVFSCRTMNMGIEQFVYEYLGRPDITIVPEVAYPLDHHDKIDWITIEQKADKPTTLIHNDDKLLLVGGCDLLQLASFCSPNRVEFVNKTEIIDGNEYVVRYDDPSFFLANRDRLSKSREINDLPCWKYNDALALDRHLQDASIIILSMREGLNHNYVRTKDDIYVRIPARNMNIYEAKRFDWFKQNFTIIKLNIKNRLELIEKSFELTKRRSRRDAAIFILGANTRNEFVHELTVSSLYNQFCRRFCRQNENKFYFVDINEVVPRKCLVDNRHFTRDGYYALSMHIMSILSTRSEGVLPEPREQLSHKLRPYRFNE